MAAAQWQPIALDAAITQLRARSDLDARGEEILAAATTLRDSKGRDRKDALRLMCGAWGVDRRQQIDGKWKDGDMHAMKQT